MSIFTLFIRTARGPSLSWLWCPSNASTLLLAHETPWCAFLDLLNDSAFDWRYMGALTLAASIAPHAEQALHWPCHLAYAWPHSAQRNPPDDDPDADVNDAAAAAKPRAPPKIAHHGERDLVPNNPPPNWRSPRPDRRASNIRAALPDVFAAIFTLGN